MQWNHLNFRYVKWRYLLGFHIRIMHVPVSLMCHHTYIALQMERDLMVSTVLLMWQLERILKRNTVTFSTLRYVSRSLLYWSVDRFGYPQYWPPTSPDLDPRSLAFWSLKPVYSYDGNCIKLPRRARKTEAEVVTLKNFCMCSNENVMEVLVRLWLLLLSLLFLTDNSITLESRAYVYVTFLSVSDLRNKIL